MSIGALLPLVFLFYPFIAPFFWFEEKVRRPIVEFLDRIASNLCCEDQTVSRDVGQRIGYYIARMAHELPFCRSDVLEHAIPFIARFDDGHFRALIIWELEEAVVLKAVAESMARVGYIEDCYKEQRPIVTLLREFSYGRMTLRDLLYSHPCYQSRASA